MFGMAASALALGSNQVVETTMIPLRTMPISSASAIAAPPAAAADTEPPGGVLATTRPPPRLRPLAVKEEMFPRPPPIAPMRSLSVSNERRACAMLPPKIT